MVVNDHGGTCGSPKSVSALIETANSHYESASEPDGPGSGLKTATGTSKTARGQRGSVMSPGESALVQSDSVTRETGHTTHQTTSGDDVTLPETRHHMTVQSGKSESGSGPREEPPTSLESDRASLSTEAGESTERGAGRASTGAS